MAPPAPPPPTPPLSGAPPTSPRRGRRLLLWSALVALLVAVQVALLWLTWQLEHVRVQESTEDAAAVAAADVRQRLTEQMQALQQLLWAAPGSPGWSQAATPLLQQYRELMRIEVRDADFRLRGAVTSPSHPGQFGTIPRQQMSLDAQTACATALRYSAPAFSRSYFVPTTGGLGQEVVDLCLPSRLEGRHDGAMIGTIALRDLLEQALPPATLREYEVLLVEADGTRLARAGARRGAGVYRAERLVDLAGLLLPLRLESTARQARWIPNLSAALVIALGVALAGVVTLLGYDVRRRSAAEQRLAEALAVRKAMEDSLVTGLRARDLDGRITHVNAAFCRMVGFSAEELRAADTPPYWPPEMAGEYGRRQAERMAGASPPREGHETVFMRRGGERFPVLIFEAPLVDGRGRHQGWMSSVLDLGPQRRIEELSRQQQEKLQAAARLATMGEMATLLSHELNQPLAAIASYASGSLNLLPADATDPPADRPTQQMLRQAMERIAEQAERAGRVIRSVHQFVRRRDRLREPVRADALIEAVLPLIRLAARRIHCRVEIDLAQPVPRVSCDRTMVEQVLLNLARNGIQAMEDERIAPAERVLALQVRALDGRWIEWRVIDRGLGIPAEVGGQLFTPFFTTKPEGMGMGLAMCRTVIEQHGGSLDFTSLAWSDAPGAAHGTQFRFTLPAAALPARPGPAG
ncbi:MAG: ATP-binding protein [Burkholderiaceae bacterium]|nr:ATP-binding protein [Burkholderiaceae bacterium]